MQLEVDVATGHLYISVSLYIVGHDLADEGDFAKIGADLADQSDGRL